MKGLWSASGALQVQASVLRFHLSCGVACSQAQGTKLHIAAGPTAFSKVVHKPLKSAGALAGLPVGQSRTPHPRWPEGPQ